MNQNHVVDKLFREHFGNKFVTGIEIGTKCADVTRHLLWAMPNCYRLFTIDPWRHFPGKEFEAGEQQPFHDKNKEMALTRLAEPEFKERVTILDCTSEEALQKIWLKKVNFVCIDGDHSEIGINFDIDHYDEFVLPGGIMFGHDYGLAPAVKIAVDRKYGNAVQLGEDFTWFVFK